jgi:hypothetical protein
VAVANVDRVNAPSFVGTAGVAAHPPPQPAPRTLNWWQAHHSRNETFGIAAPCLKTSDRTAPIGCDGTIVSAHEKSARGNILKRVAIVTAELQHSAVEAKARVLARCFKIEILPKRQTCQATLEEIKLKRAEPLVAYQGRIINVCSIGRGIGRGRWHSGI